MDTKPWWQSKTIWAQLVAGAAFGLKWIGIDVTGESAALVDGILNVVGFVSLLVGIYGRWAALKVIGPKTSSNIVGGPKLSLLLLGAIMAVGSLGISGCASVAPGNDPVVVNAERTTAVAADAFDSFLKSEYDSRDALKAASPAVYQQVHSYAEYLRHNGKRWLVSARTMTEAYRVNRTPQNKANLQTILNTITAAVAEAQKYLAQAAAAQR